MADGSEPVSDFIDVLAVRAQVAVDNQIDRLNMLSTTDPPLPFSHSSQIRGHLREVRCHYDSTLYRVLYRRSDNLFVLLHIIEKRTGPIPEQDIRIAERLGIKYRSARNLSQEDLAEIVHTSGSAISRLESGQHHPSVETLRKAAQALGLRLTLVDENQLVAAG